MSPSELARYTILALTALTEWNRKDEDELICGGVLRLQLAPESIDFKTQPPFPATKKSEVKSR
jgi:hypothetical protein